MIDDVSALAGISTGNLSINGTSINIDTSVDSLNDVITRINTSDADVTANFSSGVFRIESNVKKADMVLVDGTSNFFAGVSIVEDTYNAFSGLPRKAQRTLGDDFERSIAEINTKLESLFKKTSDTLFEAQIGSGRDQLRDAIRSPYKENRTLMISGFGIDFNFGKTAGDLITFNRTKFLNALNKTPADIFAFLLGEKRTRFENGLFPELLTALDDIEAVLKRHQATGQMVNINA